jgi:hypothetical protein
MITPRYMICSEGKLVDRETGLVSHINVIDKVLVTRGAHLPGQPTPSIRFFVSAVWCADEAALGETCEWEFLVSFPGDSEPRRLASGEFQLTTPFHRFDVLFQTMAGDPSKAQVVLRTGPLRFTSRVRLAGTDEWLSQDYVVPVEVISSAKPGDRVSEEIQSKG